MDTKIAAKITLKSPLYFWGGLFFNIVFAYSCFSTFTLTTTYDWIVNSLSGIIFLFIAYGVCGSGTVVKLFEDSIIESKWLGLGGKTVFLLKDLRLIDPRPKPVTRYPKFLLQFDTGSICLYEFQDSFNDARTFFEKTYPQLWITGL